MFNKNIRNKIKLFVSIGLCAIAVLSTPVTAITTLAAESGDVEVYTDYREWRYKIENSKLYKALYNASTGLWETDWIYVCDWPEGI